MRNSGVGSTHSLEYTNSLYSNDRDDNSGGNEILIITRWEVNIDLRDIG